MRVIEVVAIKNKYDLTRIVFREFRTRKMARARVIKLFFFVHELIREGT